MALTPGGGGSTPTPEPRRVERPGGPTMPEVVVGGSGDGMLRRGSTGSEVRELQRLLGITVDGDFGPKTEAAVREYQRRNGLSVDGVVGPQTWGSLRSGGGSTGGSSSSGGSSSGGSTSSSSSGGSSGGGSSAPGSTQQIAGGYELWKVAGSYKIAYQVPGGDTYLTWKVEDRERLTAIFGSNPDIDRNMSASQYRRISPINMGLSAEIQNTSENPWRQFMSNFKEEAKRRPWLNDPSVLATMAGAYLEGRTPSRDELSETDWWEEHTEEERQLMEYSVTAGRAQLKERIREEAAKWLGPAYGKLTPLDVDRWAVKIDKNPHLADNFLRTLQKQNRAIFSGFYKDLKGGDPNVELTYDDITKPFRNLGSQVWGQPFRDEDLLVQIANMGDFTEASTKLRDVGLRQGVDKVVDDAVNGLGDTSMGDEIVRQQV